MYFKNIFDIETQKLCRSRKASFSSTIYDLDPDYWIIEEHDDGNLLLIIPLFHCNKLFSSNPDDIVIEKNKAIICRNNINTIIKAKSVLETVVKIDVNTSVLGVGETVIIDVDVSDENGFPLKDIEVELFESGQKVDNIKSVYTNSSGKCSFEYPFNYDGPFKFHVKVKDTKDYVGMVSNVVFVDTHVKDTMCLLESEYSSVNVGQPFRLLGKLLDLRGNPAGNMKLKLLKDNVLIEESFTDDKGRVSFDLLSDVGGVFTYQLVFDGVEKYRASSSRVVNVSVMKELTTIEVANGSIFVGDSYIIPYSVYDNNNNRPINVGNVELYFDDELLSTVVAGEELTVSPIVTSSYRLVYIGNGNYESSEANFTVEVNKLSTVTSLSSNVDSVVAGGEVVLTAFVKDSSGNPVSNIEVQLYRDGVSLGEEYKSITNESGKVTFNLIVNEETSFKTVVISNSHYKSSESSSVIINVETVSNVLFFDSMIEPNSAWNIGEGVDVEYSADGMSISKSTSGEEYVNIDISSFNKPYKASIVWVDGFGGTKFNFCLDKQTGYDNQNYLSYNTDKGAFWGEDKTRWYNWTVKELKGGDIITVEVGTDFVAWYHNNDLLKKWTGVTRSFSTLGFYANKGYSYTFKNLKVEKL